MEYYKFERAARNNRHKAIFFTLAFHVALLGGLAYSGEVEVKEYVPATVQEWLGMDADNPAADSDMAPRP